MDVLKIIDHYYGEGDSKLKSLLLNHSQSVAQRALKVAENHPELNLDREFLYDASMLHDIGIIECHAPSIYCHGWADYICHGIIGSRMLRWYGVDNRYARVCARHTGAGLTQKDIVCQELPLHATSLMPETIEEKVICYADKFFSKTHLGEEKTLEHIERSLSRFGKEGLERFRQWHQIFS